MSEQDVIITTKNLTKRFKIICSTGGKRYNKVISAIDHVSIEIEAGTVFGLLGPNGSGKTTLLKLLACLLYPDKGTAFVCGFDIRKRAHRREIRARTTIITSGRWIGFNPFTSIRKSLEYYAYLNGLNSRDAKIRVKEALECLGLNGFEDESIMFLSSGMRQRALLASALLVRTPIVLLDEPTIGLDIRAAQEFRSLIRKMSKEYGQTILISTHYIEEAEVLCDKVAILNKGKVVAVGSPSELKKKVSPYNIVTIQLPEINPNILKSISSMDAVLKVDLKTLRRSLIELTIRYSYEKEVMPELLKTLVDAGCKFYFIEKKFPSLEDVFFKLMEVDK